MEPATLNRADGARRSVLGTSYGSGPSRDRPAKKEPRDADQADPQDFAGREKERLDALAAGDVATTEALLSEELYYGHSSGFSDTKASYLAAVRDGRYVYRHASASIDRTIPLGAEAFIVTGEETLDVVMNGKPQVMHSVYVGVWRREDGQWRFVCHQSAPKPAS